MEFQIFHAYEKAGSQNYGSRVFHSMCGWNEKGIFEKDGKIYLLL